MQANTAAIANVSAVARPLQAPAADAAVDARARALRAKYVALAGQPDAISLALTGRRLSQLPPEQQVRLQSFVKALKADTLPWPQWRMAQRSEGGPTTGRSDALFNSAVAAFVPSTSGGPGTALLAKGLDSAARDLAITEELGEALAHAAAAAGVDVGAGDRGARLAAALGGQRTFSPAEFQARSDDQTVVQLDGKLVSAMARQTTAAKRPAATKPLVLELNNLVPGDTYLLSTNGPNKSVRADAQGQLTVQLKLGQSLSIRSDNGRQTVDLNIDHAGTARERVTLKVGNNEVTVRPATSDKPLPGVLQRWFGKGPKGGAQLALRMPSDVVSQETQAKQDWAYVRIDGAYGFVRFSVNGKKYAVIDKESKLQGRTHVQLRNELAKQGYAVLYDLDRGAGFIGFKIRKGSDLQGWFQASGQPESFSFPFTLQDVGTAMARGTAPFVFGSPSPGIATSSKPNPETSTDVRRNFTSFKVLAQPPGNIAKDISDDIKLAETSLNAAINQFQSLGRSGSYEGFGKNLDAITKDLDHHLTQISKSLANAAKNYAENKDYLYNHATHTALGERLDSLKKVTENALPDAIKGMLDGISGDVIKQGAAKVAELREQSANRILGLVNNALGMAFFVLGFANGVKAYLPTVFAAGSGVGATGKGLATAAVWSGGIPLPSQITQVIRGDALVLKAIKKGNPGEVTSQQAWDYLSKLKGTDKILQQKLRDHLIKFQVDIASNGPWGDKSPEIPAEKNPFWNDPKMAGKIGRIKEGQTGTNASDWKLEEWFKRANGDNSTEEAKKIARELSTGGKISREQQDERMKNAGQGKAAPVAVNLATKFAELFKDSKNIKGTSGSMTTLRVAQLPRDTGTGALALFTREAFERPKSGPNGTFFMELWAVRPWLGIE